MRELDLLDPALGRAGAQARGRAAPFDLGGTRAARRLARGEGQPSSSPCARPAPAISSVCATLRTCATNAAGSNSPSRRRWPRSAPTGTLTVFAAVTAGSALADEARALSPRSRRAGVELANRSRARRGGRCRGSTSWLSSSDTFKVPGPAPDVAPAPAAEDEARLLGELRRNLAEQRGLTARATGGRAHRWHSGSTLAGADHPRVPGNPRHRDRRACGRGGARAPTSPLVRCRLRLAGRSCGLHAPRGRRRVTATPLQPAARRCTRSGRGE